LDCANLVVHFGVVCSYYLFYGHCNCFALHVFHRFGSVQKFMFHDVIIMKGLKLMNIMSTAIVTFLCLARNFVGMSDFSLQNALW